ncbi:MAG: type I-E CRISPR-associated protein Cas5/CasD [Deltaproteobacteria bacterium]
MAEIILLRLEGPLMSFGGPLVDQQGVTQRYPALSMVTGLIANALGFDHSEADSTQALQTRIRYAVRADRPGHALQDYQTVDLGQDHLAETGWTTRGKVDERGTGKATSGTHIRFRDYWADACFTVALTLTPGKPSLDDVAAALQQPARPIFLGRKSCLPSAPIHLARVEAGGLLAALQDAPRTNREKAGDRVSAWWPDDEPLPDGVGAPIRLPVTDARDWRNQVHVGRRVICEGLLRLPEVPK